MRYRAVSGFGVDVAFLLLYAYSDAFRNFIDYLVILLFRVPTQQVPLYVIPFATLLLVASVALGILDALNISIPAALRDIRNRQPKSGILEAEIFGEPENKFLVGGTLCFRARYRGILKNGYFTTKIRVDVLSTIHDTEREYEWLPDYNTNIRKPEGPNKESGTLNGRGSGWLRKSHSSTWGHKIPFMYPPGRHEATLMVFDDTSPSVPLSKTDVPLIFTVLDEELLPMRGWTSQGQLIPAPRSMFVRKPMKRNWRGALH